MIAGRVSVSLLVKVTFTFIVTFTSLWICISGPDFRGKGDEVGEGGEREGRREREWREGCGVGLYL